MADWKDNLIETTPASASWSGARRGWRYWG